MSYLKNTDKVIEIRIRLLQKKESKKRQIQALQQCKKVIEKLLQKRSLKNNRRPFNVVRKSSERMTQTVLRELFIL